MKNWFTSLNGAITLSFTALLIQVFRGLIDSMFVYHQEFPGMELALAAGFAVAFGVWIKGLLAASGGSRRGMIAAFAVGLWLWVTQDWGTILVFCAASGCASVWSSIAAWADVLIGGSALIALGLQIWRRPASIRA